MRNRYDWINGFIEELKKLNEADADYVQVALLKKLDKTWSNNADPLIKEMTYEDPFYYIVRMKNEITEALYEYLKEYIDCDYYLSRCMYISITGISNGRKRVYMDIVDEMRSSIKTCGLSKAVHAIDYKGIIAELTGMDFVEDLWATVSIYQAFKNGIAGNQDWQERYCTDILNSLKQIRQQAEAKKDLFYQFDTKHIDLEQIAPCGLICSVCEHAIYDDPPCPGCRGEGDGKIEFCKSVCRIPKCEKRLKNDWAFCNECPDYPCEEVAEKQVRYTSKYPLLENPMALQDKLRSNGITKTLKELKAEWICPKCGEYICVHTGTCKNHCKD